MKDVSEFQKSVTFDNGFADLAFFKFQVRILKTYK